MKRSYVYLAGASLVCASGLIAIAQAQRGTPAKSDAEPAAAALFSERVSKAPKPIPLVPETTRDETKFSDTAKTHNPQPAAGDPFQAARIDATFSQPVSDQPQTTIGIRAARSEEDATPVRQVPVRQTVVRDEIPAADALAQAGSEITASSTTNDRDVASRAAGDPFGLQNKSSADAPRKFAVKQAGAETPVAEAPATSRSPWGQVPAATASSADPGDAPSRASAPVGTNSLRMKKTDQASSDQVRADQGKVDPFGGSDPAADRAAQAPGGSKYPGRPAPFGNEPQDARALGSSAQEGFVTVPRDAAPLQPVDNGRTIEGTGRPGVKQSEGQQTAQVTIEKKAPAEIQIGKSATFEIKVKNVGSVGAQNVEVHDEVPKGTQLVSTTPKANRGPRGELMWVLGSLKAGEETTVKVELMPVGEGEIGSVATLHFDAEATARTISTRPELAVQVAVPRQVMIGDDITLAITVSNPGTGAAAGVVLEERVPTGLQHTATGRDDLEFEIGVLKPGQSRQLDLTLKAVQAGKILNMLSVRGDANLRVEEKSDIEVIAPALKVGLSGPTKRFLDRPATYTVSVSNPGTAAAKDVELITYLPKGLKFVKADNSGHYDVAKHRVIWSLAELPPSESGAVKLTAVPIEEGEQKMRIEGKAQQGLSDMEEQAIVVEGVAAIMFEVTDLEDPVEVGGEATYEIRVINQGSRAATNIRVSATLPNEMKALDGTGPTRAALDDKRVVFDALNRLAPKTDATFRVRAQVLKAGDLRMKAQVVTDEMQTPVTKEESTRVYQDE